MIRTFLVIVFLTSILFVQNSEGLAFDDNPANKSEKAGHTEEEKSNPLLWLVSLFKDHISAVDSDRCPSLPSCSSYSIKAIKKHGIFIGWVMTVDRLIHEGREETKVSPMVFSEGKWKIYDPVENNDFWWYKPERRADE